MSAGRRGFQVGDDVHIDTPVPLRKQKKTARPNQSIFEEPVRVSPIDLTTDGLRKKRDPSKRNPRLYPRVVAEPQLRKKAPKPSRGKRRDSLAPDEEEQLKGAPRSKQKSPSKPVADSNQGRAPRRSSPRESRKGKTQGFFSKTFIWAFKGVFWLVACIVLLFSVIQGSLWVYNSVRTSELFLVKHIDVTGNIRLSKKEILELAQVKEGMNSFECGVVDVERGLCRTPWIESASVRRVLPDKFVINVKERVPSFWLVIDGKTFYATDEGRPIAPVDGVNFVSLPVLNLERGSEDLLPYLKLLLRDMRSGRLPVELGAISSVHVSLGRGISMYLGDRDLQLALGSDDWEGNLLRLGVVIADLARRQELHFTKEVHAAEGNVWVLKRKI